MAWIVPILLSSIAAFVATNIDDLIILMLFFAQVSSTLRPQHIVAGQYFGFTALILASLPGFFGGMFISKPLIGLLGFLPIVLGVLQLFGTNDDNESEPTVTTAASSQTIASFLHPQTYGVAAVTFANGGDNIGIYVPLFASCSWLGLGITLTVFFVLVGLWCAIAYLFASHRTIAPLLHRYSDRLVPVVLIVLGFYILLENGSWQLLGV